MGRLFRHVGRPRLKKLPKALALPLNGSETPPQRRRRTKCPYVAMIPGDRFFWPLAPDSGGIDVQRRRLTQSMSLARRNTGKDFKKEEGDNGYGWWVICIPVRSRKRARQRSAAVKRMERNEFGYAVPSRHTALQGLSRFGLEALRLKEGERLLED